MLQKYIQWILPFLCIGVLTLSVNANDYTSQLADEIHRILRTHHVEGGEFLIHISPNGTTLYQINPVNHGNQQAIQGTPQAQTGTMDTANQSNAATRQPRRARSGAHVIEENLTNAAANNNLKQQSQSANVATNNSQQQSQSTNTATHNSQQQNQTANHDANTISFSNAHVVIYQNTDNQNTDNQSTDNQTNHTGQGNTRANRNNTASSARANRTQQTSPSMTQNASSNTNPATHGDAVMMLMRMASLPSPHSSNTNEAPLSNNDTAVWINHIQTAVAHGIIAPDTDGYFNPERELTWNEMAVYLNRVFHLPANAYINNHAANPIVSKGDLALVEENLHGYKLKDLRALPYKS